MNALASVIDMTPLDLEDTLKVTSGAADADCSLNKNQRCVCVARHSSE